MTPGDVPLVNSPSDVGNYVVGVKGTGGTFKCPIGETHIWFTKVGANYKATIY